MVIAHDCLCVPLGDLVVFIDHIAIAKIAQQSA
jgi:hypothetical protein